LTDAARFATWPTPAARDFRHANAKPYAERGGGAKGEQLNNAAVHLCSWPTPRATDGDKGARTGDGSRTEADRCLGVRGLDLPTTGSLAIGSPVETAKPGQLNPAHSRWLMGLPPEWDACAPTATRSSPRSRRSS
jgi:hypothetical protein